VDPYVNETEYVAHEHRSQRDQHAETAVVRDFELQHHDGEDSVAEGFAYSAVSSSWSIDFSLELGRLVSSLAQRDVVVIAGIVYIDGQMNPAFAQ